LPDISGKEALMSAPNVSEITRRLECLDMGDFFGGVELKIEHGKIVLAKLTETYTRKSLVNDMKSEELNGKYRK
jgi:hypothetical protein